MKSVTTSDLQHAADSLQVERLLLHEAGVAALRQAAGPELLEEAGQVENLFGLHVAVTPHYIEQTHTGGET